MTATDDLKRSVELRLIANDLIFARRFLDDFVRNQKQNIVPFFCFNNYLSLFIHESHKTLKRIEPQLAASLELENSPIIERARHTVKLFDDNNMKLSGVSERFSERIIPDHRRYFIGKIWFPPARIFGKDLGLYYLGDRIISTSHVTSFYLGISAESFEDMDLLGRLMHSVAVDQGKYVAALTDAWPWQGPSPMGAFASAEIRSLDVKSHEYYARAFSGQFDPGVTAALTALQSSMNFLTWVLAADTSSASHATTTKLKFITLYHALSSLKKLRTESGTAFTAESGRLLDTILDHETSGIIMNDDARGFRNTLMHYGLDSRLDVARLSLDLPLCGLVEAYYPNHNFSQLSRAVNEHTERVAGLLNEWSE
jgi:hypothetical protein